jgi:phosphoenolpyruvate carboxykinase (ATP)
MIKRNLTRSQLIEEALRNEEGLLSNDGALLVRTGTHTGRAAKDKFIVKNDASSDVDWGDVNRPMEETDFQRLKGKILRYLETHTCYEQALSVGADPKYAMPLVVRTSLASQSLFARTLFRGPLKVPQDKPELAPFTIYAVPEVFADPEADGTRSDVFIALNFRTREVLIGGTQYAGEIKKSVFTIMNTLLPRLGIMTMHAAANVGVDGDSAIFFGLSGTGKTTLSSDPARCLVGDDEHGWSDEGIFNFEGGCYAKAIRLSAKAEPQIWQACHSYGTLIENVMFDLVTRSIDFDADTITENTRAAYALDRIPHSVASGTAGAPKAIVMLACDAFGVLPPVARLTPEQAMYYFLSGYTAKVAGTETGITEPTTTFSACFGQPFMTLKPTVYAELLARQISRNGSECYLVNTGWWKGPYGQGERMPIAVSRAIVSAAVDGSLASVPCRLDPTFGFRVPEVVPGLESTVLDQRASWPDAARYDAQCTKLAGLFSANFSKHDGPVASRAREAGPSARHV